MYLQSGQIFSLIYLNQMLRLRILRIPIEIELYLQIRFRYRCLPIRRLQRHKYLSELCCVVSHQEAFTISRAAHEADRYYVSSLPDGLKPKQL